MSTRRDWHRLRQQQQMREHGSEPWNGGDLTSLLPRRPRPPQLSKQKLRDQGEAAMREWKAKQKPK
jgi:hypothetical protein